MESNVYERSEYPVTEAFGKAHASFWRRLESPGEWWSSAERVKIAEEVRAAPECRLCRERKSALSPNAVAGAHDCATDLPDDAVEVIHRVVTDPGRLSRKWFEQMTAGELSDAHYVEILGILVAVVSIDSFCQGIGLQAHPLPVASAGEPDRHRPAGAAMEAAWVPMIKEDKAVGPEADLYGGAERMPNVIRAMSLVPDAVYTLRELLDAHYPGGPSLNADGRVLTRPQMELLAARVSAIRECFY